VDDKIIARSNEREIGATELADQFIGEMNKDFAALGILPPDIEPRVSTHIDEIIAMVQQLEANGLAYNVDGDVFFDVRGFEPYGVLSRRNLDDLQSGARVGVDERKRNAMDFALWKSVKPGEPYWESPWGNGRPGWHIECSAMSCTHLGEEFDIHGGGMDLIFPHHENEIAQSHGASGQVPVRYWMHNGFVNIDSEKMSKSLGNFFTIREVLERYHPQVIRYFLLTTHYRNPINYSDSNLDEASARVTYLYDTLRLVDTALADGIDTENGPIIEEALVDSILPNFKKAMDDDFNTPAALGHLSDVLKLANQLVCKKRKTKGRGRTLKIIKERLSEVACVLGICDASAIPTLKELCAKAVLRLGIDEAAVNAAVDARTAAREAKEWARADELRAELTAMGVEVMDTPDGTMWRPVVQCAD